MRLHLGVDGSNLLDDRRGMGRFARDVLRAAYDAADIYVTLISKRPRSPSMYSAVLEREVPVVFSAPAARRRALDVLWYPWNGMPFTHRARSVVTIHDVFAFTAPHRNVVSRFREQQPVRRAVLKADSIVTVSRWSADEITRVFAIARERIRVIPHAPRPFWTPVVLPATTGDPYFLFVSGPEPRKNAPLLFAAFQEAFSRREAELVIAGTLSRGDRSMLDRTDIRFRHLHPDDEQLRALYTGALAVTVPSLAEGFGLVAIEAMACGTAVLASNACALPEACGEGAELLNPFDRAAWSAALRKVFENAAFREELRGRAARRKAQFDSAAPAREMLALLRDSARP